MNKYNELQRNKFKPVVGKFVAPVTNKRKWLGVVKGMKFFSSGVNSIPSSSSSCLNVPSLKNTHTDSHRHNQKETQKFNHSHNSGTLYLTGNCQSTKQNI